MTAPFQPLPPLPRDPEFIAVMGHWSASPDGIEAKLDEMKAARSAKAKRASELRAVMAEILAPRRMP